MHTHAASRSPRRVTRRLLLARSLAGALANLVLLAPLPSAAQEPAGQAPAGQAPAGPLWDSYVRAAAVLGRALEAHGGRDAIRRLTAASYRWEGEDYAPTQGRIPAATWDTAGNGRATLEDVRVDFARRRSVVDRELRFPGGYLNAFRTVTDGRDALTYNPLPARGMGGTAYQRDTTGAVAARTLAALGAGMPAFLLRDALEHAASLRYVGAARDGARREEAVTYTGAGGAPVTLYVDDSTHLVSRSEDVGLGSLGDEVDATLYSEYRTVDGVAVPHRVEVRWNGLLAGRRRLARFAARADLGDSLLRVPPGYAPAPPPGPPAAVRVTDGVYFLERLGGGYRMLVVDTDSGVVAVDAPLSPRVSEAAIALIERTLPGRPIRWVVVTHHHGDHIGGLPAFAARGATILVAPGAEAYVRRMSTVRRTFGQLGAPPAAPGANTPNVEPLRGRRTIGTGARAVEVLDVGPTSHAAAMLAVHVPAARLLFQGDLLRINAQGGPVASPEATRDLERIVRRFRLDVRTIGAVHGVNGTVDDLRAALRPREADVPARPSGVSRRR